MKFPRNCKKFNNCFLDEDGEAGSFKATGKRIHKISGTCSNRDVYPNTNRMKRVLKKQAGRPWNDVQSEFLKEFDSRTFEGHTIREWLDYIVEQDVILHDDGRITDPRGLRVGFWWEELYVHPITGTLEVAPSQRSKYRRTFPKTVFEMDGTLYHEHEGLWYRVKMKNFEKKKQWWGYGYDYLVLDPPDVFVKDEWGFRATRRYNSFSYSGKYGLDPKGRGWYCIWKQSANSREIAKLQTIVEKVKKKAA